jgi:hypothetical protein
MFLANLSKILSLPVASQLLWVEAMTTKFTVSKQDKLAVKEETSYVFSSRFFQ